MKEKDKSFKAMNPLFAFIIAVLSGLFTISLGGQMLKIANQILELIHNKPPSNLNDWTILGTISLYGLLAYGCAIIFQVSHKRVIDYIYEKQ